MILVYINNLLARASDYKYKGNGCAGFFIIHQARVLCPFVLYAEKLSFRKYRSKIKNFSKIIYQIMTYKVSRVISFYK